MAFISGKDQICGEFAKALGLDHCFGLELSMHTDSAMKCNASFFVTDEKLKEIITVTKKYKFKLIEIEDE